MKAPQPAEVIEYETYGEAVVYDLDEGRYLEPTEAEYQKMVKAWDKATKRTLRALLKSTQRRD